METALAGMTGAELTARLSQADIAFGAVNSVADLSGHPQLRRVEVGSPTGPVSMPAPPVRTSAGGAPLRPSPGLGEHAAAIRSEFS
jgi:crotonobetainyl-CoA:carnitine CoA-transferase CaiB-like acyl-CoA transferase